MKIVRNIIIVILVLLLLGVIGFCICIAPNYKKSGYEDRTNLVINFRNVTGTMKGEVIRENGYEYVSLDDINNYFDRYTYYDSKYNYIIATGNGHIACFDINAGTVKIDNNTVNAKIIEKDNLKYIPINLLEDFYDIKVKYNESTNIVAIESTNTELKAATTNTKVSIKSKQTNFSRTLEKVDKGSTVYVKEVAESENTDSTPEPQTLKGKIIRWYNNMKKKMSKDWVTVRTENGTIGYVNKKSLGDIKVVREAAKEVEKAKVSLVWDYFENTIATPKNDSNTTYKGINVVSPSFMFVDENGNIKENVGDSGLNYISWAKSKGYEIWSMVKCDNLLTDNMRSMLSDYKKRESLINQIIQICQKYSFNGVNIDMENINQSDKEYFSRLIIELKPRLESLGMKLSVDVTAPDGSPNWSLCYDRKTIGDVADYIVFMAYDQTSKNGSRVGSNASIEWVENNINKFIKNNEVDSRKIIVAIPFFSRMWKVNSDGTSAGSFDINMNKQDKYLAKATKKEWLADACQNYIEYVENGFTYKMWVEDEESVSKKLDLVEQYNLGGVAFWEKGCETENIWNVVEQKLF
ncbi:MAG: hypothetical protein IKE91_01150 [Clostridia bacterium]|nr:hypothetical protein [Clostridia bacterium]